MRTLLLALPLLAAAAGDVRAADPPSSGETATVGTAPHRYFRLGLRAYATIDHDGGDAAALKPGVIATIPLTLDFKYGLGMRIAFTAAHFQNSVFDVAWNEVANDPATSKEYTYTGTDNRSIYYGATVGFNYEVTVPEEPFFKVFQPFVGVGVAILWVRTHPDVPAQDSVLISNDFYRGPDQKDYDPWSLQVRAGLDLYGGFHLNASRTFRFPIEFGYRMVPVPEHDLMWGTEGYDYRHLEYLINTFNIGGGLEWLF